MADCEVCESIYARGRILILMGRAVQEALTAANPFKPKPGLRPAPDGTYWITVKGRKIPIKEGEDFDKVVQEHTGSSGPETKDEKKARKLEEKKKKAKATIAKITKRLTKAKAFDDLDSYREEMHEELKYRNLPEDVENELVEEQIAILEKKGGKSKKADERKAEKEKKEAEEKAKRRAEQRKEEEERKDKIKDLTKDMTEYSKSVSADYTHVDDLGDKVMEKFDKPSYMFQSEYEEAISDALKETRSDGKYWKPKEQREKDDRERERRDRERFEQEQKDWPFDDRGFAKPVSYEKFKEFINETDDMNYQIGKPWNQYVRHMVKYYKETGQPVPDKWKRELDNM